MTTFLKIYNEFYQFWASKTKIVFPNTESDTYQGTYTDTDTVAYLDVVLIDKVNIIRTIPAVLLTNAELVITLVSEVGDGSGKLLEYCDSIDSHYQFKDIEVSDDIFRFKGSKVTPIFIDNGHSVINYSIPFYFIQ